MNTSSSNGMFGSPVSGVRRGYPTLRTTIDLQHKFKNLRITESKTLRPFFPFLTAITRFLISGKYYE